MYRKIIFLHILTLLTATAFCQSSDDQYKKELAGKKDTESVTMVNLYNSSQFRKLNTIFPNYKAYTAVLDSIKLFSSGKFFSMRPNFLTGLQGEKTKIILSLIDIRLNVVDYLITFTSNRLESQIESIKKDDRFNNTSTKDQIIKIKSDN